MGIGHTECNHLHCPRECNCKSGSLYRKEFTSVFGCFETRESRVAQKVRSAPEAKGLWDWAAKLLRTVRCRTVQADPDDMVIDGHDASLPNSIPLVLFRSFSLTSISSVNENVAYCHLSPLRPILFLVFFLQRKLMNPECSPFASNK